MVTNTYRSLDQNHFSLQIPGSGWGLFDDCANHFPNSSSISEQYQHVIERSQCASLPAAVQAGCYWRFDWFQNATNPDVRFKQVLCPPALVDRIIPAVTSSCEKTCCAWYIFLGILMFVVQTVASSSFVASIASDCISMISF